uniref:Uncharacterized protein n=1 Tax=Anguilla anguilla TaxID=7936 RepID=A0A0E9RET1_ANGAN
MKQVFTETMFCYTNVHHIYESCFLLPPLVFSMIELIAVSSAAS